MVFNMFCGSDVNSCFRISTFLIVNIIARCLSEGGDKIRFKVLVACFTSMFVLANKLFTIPPITITLLGCGETTLWHSPRPNSRCLHLFQEKEVFLISPSSSSHLKHFGHYQNPHIRVTHTYSFLCIC